MIDLTVKIIFVSVIIAPIAIILLFLISGLGLFISTRLIYLILFFIDSIQYWFYTLKRKFKKKRIPPPHTEGMP